MYVRFREKKLILFLRQTKNYCSSLLLQKQIIFVNEVPKFRTVGLCTLMFTLSVFVWKPTRVYDEGEGETNGFIVPPLRDRTFFVLYFFLH